MNRGLRRPLIALVVTVVVVGAWVGAPLMAAPADPLGLDGSPGIAVAGVSDQVLLHRSPVRQLPRARHRTAVSPPRISPSPGTAATRVPAHSPGVPSSPTALRAPPPGECDAAPRGGPRYASGAPPRQIRDPGHLGFDPVRRRLGLARRGRPRGRRRQAEGDRRDRLPGRERLEDVHLGAHPAPGRGRPPRPRRFGAVLPADPRASPGRSPSASCSTTRAACATSSSTRASTTTC